MAWIISQALMDDYANSPSSLAHAAESFGKPNVLAVIIDGRKLDTEDDHIRKRPVKWH